MKGFPETLSVTGLIHTSEVREKEIRYAFQQGHLFEITYCVKPKFDLSYVKSYLYSPFEIQKFLYDSLG